MNFELDGKLGSQTRVHERSLTPPFWVESRSHLIQNSSHALVVFVRLLDDIACCTQCLTNQRHSRLKQVTRFQNVTIRRAHFRDERQGQVLATLHFVRGLCGLDTSRGNYSISSALSLLISITYHGGIEQERNCRSSYRLKVCVRVSVSVMGPYRCQPVAFRSGRTYAVVAFCPASMQPIIPPHLGKAYQQPDSHRPTRHLRQPRRKPPDSLGYCHRALIQVQIVASFPLDQSVGTALSFARKNPAPCNSTTPDQALRALDRTRQAHHYGRLEQRRTSSRNENGFLKSAAECAGIQPEHSRASASSTAKSLLPQLKRQRRAASSGPSFFIDSLFAPHGKTMHSNCFDKIL